MKQYINLQFKCDDCKKEFFVKDGENVGSLYPCPCCGGEAHYTEYFEEIEE